MIDINKLNNITWLQTNEVNWPYDNQTANTKLDSIDKFQANLSWFDAYLKKSMRDLEYWDAYHFTASVDRAEDFAAKYAGLANNEALIINTAFDNYKVGDVVLKDHYGEQHHIPSKQAGAFKPSIYDSATKILKYSYVDVVKDTDKDVSLEIPITDAPKQTIYGYSLSVEGGACQFTIAKDSNNAVILPIIKLYTFNNEEVYAHFTIDSSADSLWKLSNIPSIVAKVVVK